MSSNVGARTMPADQEVGATSMRSVPSRVAPVSVYMVVSPSDQRTMRSHFWLPENSPLVRTAKPRGCGGTSAVSSPAGY